MNRATLRPAQLEQLLAGTLHLGTWLASGVIGLGLALALFDSRFSSPKLALPRDLRIATIGIAILILLPVVRVIVMLVVYLRDRDYRFSAIALLVLTIILLGFVVGLAGRHSDTFTAPAQLRGETAPPHAMQAALGNVNSFLTGMPHTSHRQKFLSRQT